MKRSNVWEEGWWITHMMIFPASASSRIVVHTPRVMNESSPVGVWGWREVSITVADPQNKQSNAKATNTNTNSRVQTRTGRRLVREDDGGVVEKLRAEGQTLLLAARDAAVARAGAPDDGVGAVRHCHLHQHVLHALQPLGDCGWANRIN